MVFDLVDSDGNAVTQDAYRGSFALVYFGFSHCRIVCPRSLAKLSAVTDRLGDLRGFLTLIYITVDPARDSPGRLKEYLRSYPCFTGLTGSAAQVDDAKRAFRVFARRAEDPDDAAGYAVPHTAIAYLMGPDGGYIDHYPDHVDEDAIHERIARHLQGHLGTAGEGRNGMSLA